MALLQGILDNSFGISGEKILIDSASNAGKIFIYSSQTHIIYSTNNHIILHNIDTSQNLLTESISNIEINDIYLQSNILHFVGRNIQENIGVYGTCNLTSLAVNIDSMSNSINCKHVFLDTGIIHILLLDTNGNAILRKIDDTTITNINVYNNDIYFTLNGYYIHNNLIYVFIETFDETNNVYKPKIVTIDSSTTNTISLFTSSTQNIFLQKCILINNTPTIVYVAQDTITTQSVENILNLTPNTISFCALATPDTIIHSFSISDAFIESLTAISYVNGSAYLIGYVYNLSGTKINYLSALVDSTCHLDTSFSGNGYHIETSITDDYFAPLNHIETVKSNDDVYIMTPIELKDENYETIMISKLQYNVSSGGDNGNGSTNSPPIDISLNNLTIAENAGPNALVGTLSTTDPDANETFVYTLVSGFGDNSYFDISGAQLRAKQSLNYEDVHGPSYSIKVKSTDSSGNFIEREFTITVTNVNETPTDISLNNLTIAENAGVNALVGTFSTTDPDDNETFVYSLVPGFGDNIYFDISGAQLIAKQSLNFEDVHGVNYSIKVKSTDSSGNYIERQFTITVTDVNEPYYILQNDLVNDNKILIYNTGESFTFIDTQYPSLIQTSTIYYGNGNLNLGDISSSNVQASVVNATSDNRFIFSPIDSATKAANNIPGDFAMILKVIDNSGNIQTNINIPIDIYLDNSLGSIVNLYVDGENAGSGQFQEKIGNKYRYRVTLLKGNGGIYGIFSNPTSASVGSDPHITTLFGKKYDFHPSTRRNYTLFKSKDINVTSHFSGLKSGVYYDKVEVELPNKDRIKINFNKHTVKGKSSLVEMSKEVYPIKYENRTSDKSVGKIFEPLKPMTKLAIDGKNPVNMFIDFKTRYVFFEFPKSVPAISEMTGLIIDAPYLN